MKMLLIELQKEKRTGIIPLMPAVGILGALYALVNFRVRKETLFDLPLPPMDILLTQLYGMILILNLFGVIVTACMLYNIEFQGNAVKKMCLLPVKISAVYLCKFFLLTVMLLLAVCIQNLALAGIGMTDLPPDAFHPQMLVAFAGYSFLTSMPVLSFMILMSSLFENLWVPLGIGVIGFLSGMALAVSDFAPFTLHPFVIMLKPAVSMRAQPDISLIILSLIETAIFLCAGLWRSKKICCEML